MTKPQLEIEIVEAEDDNDLPKTTNQWFEKISGQLSFTNYLLFLILVASWFGAAS